MSFEIANTNEAPTNHHELQEAAREQYNTLLEEKNWPHGDAVETAKIEVLQDIVSTLKPMIDEMTQAERYYARDLSILLNQSEYYLKAKLQPIAA